MAFPAWFKVRRQLAHEPIVAGRIGGPNPVFVERYLYQDIERTVSGLAVTALVCQFGGGRVEEGGRDRLRITNLPTQSLLIPRGVPTHWHYSGTVDFAVFYFLDGGSWIVQSLEVLSGARDAPMPSSDAFVGAAARQIVEELQRGATADHGFMERLTGVMLEQALRALTVPGAGGLNPRHAHFYRMQKVLNYVHAHPAADLTARQLAQRAEVSPAHFARIFREATGVPPHDYVLATRLDMARKLLTQTTMPVARIALECGFSSQSHLTAAFRAAHSTTPAKYRAHLRTAAVPR